MKRFAHRLTLARLAGLTLLALAAWPRAGAAEPPGCNGVLHGLGEALPQRGAFAAMEKRRQEAARANGLDGNKGGGGGGGGGGGYRR